MRTAIALLFAFFVAAGVCLAETYVENLRCEYRDNPLGIDAVKPRLSWVLASDERGTKQTAYQLLVASSAELLDKDQGDLWDSGKTATDQSIHIEYAGKPLASQMRCYWKVRVWDRDGKPSPWSKPAFWSMGLLAPSDWSAEWIGYDAAYKPTPEAAKDDALLNIQGVKWVRCGATQQKPGFCTSLLRKRIDVPADRKIRRAVLALYAFNECTAAVNGKPIGEAVHWDRTARLDATAALHAGENILSITATHTDNHRPAVIGRLVVQFTSGVDLIVPIDNTWKASLTAAEGWEKASFDDTAWAAAEAFDGMPWNGPPPVADLARLPAPYLRKDFAVSKAVKRATVYVTALGVYELHLNGKRVGRDVLTPGWTEFRKRVHYQTYDVTAQVAQGENTLGAILGDGWYASDLAHLARRNVYGGKPRLLAQLVVELADGSTQIVATDGTWKASFGPIRHADLLMGCELDARLALAGWDAKGFDAKDWKPVDASAAAAARDGVADVTSLLQDLAQDGCLSLKVENEALGGDPIQGTVKSLRVTCRIDGKEQMQTFAEKAIVKIGSAEHPATIVRAEYGRADSGSQTKVQASLVEPSRVIQELAAVKVTEPRPGCYTFDLGQNMVGFVRLKVRGEPGQRITVRHAEMVNPDGTIYTASLRSCPAADFYLLSGKGEEVLEPAFTFHGFRYVEIRGLKSKPALGDVTGVVIHTDMQRTGQFECSSPAVNQLYSNIIWGQKGNYVEVPTDCPQRDERMGWTGDTQFFAPTAAYNFDVAPFFTRWLATCRDNQNADGTFPHVVPDIMGGGGATAWGDAALLCTYNVYRVYNDRRVVAEQFDAMDRYMAWLAGKTKDGVSNVGGFGDWLNAGGGASGPMIDTAYHAYLAQIMAEMAKAIGRDEDAARYAKLHDEVKVALAKAFLQPDGSLKDCSQTGYALAFSMDLLPQEMRLKAADKFVEEIKRFNWHLATGFIGTPRLLPALHLAGRDEVAYRLLLQDTYPSWLFPVKNGATTMWERWNGWTPEQGFGDISMNSFNHYAFGAVGEYLYGTVGGIQATTPGYKTIRIAPTPGEGLTWAKTRFVSIYGPIESDWRREEGKLSMRVVISANTTATVYVPTKDAQAVRESGKPAAEAKGVKFLKMSDSAAVFEVESGVYAFEVRD